MIRCRSENTDQSTTLPQRRAAIWSRNYIEAFSDWH
jgi:hypothetical protein